MRDTSWQDSKEPQKYAALKGEVETDILVVGGGMAGILCAYQLNGAGIKVLVAEKATLGGGATSLTTAFLTQDIDTNLTDLRSMFGKKKARAIWQSHQRAVDRIEEIAKKEKIACDLRRVPAYIFANDEKEFELLQEEFRTAQELDLTTVLQGRHSKSPLPFRHAGYLKIPNQAKFHPLKFLNGIAKSAARNGAVIHERTEVLKIRHGKNGVIAETPAGKIRAKQVILATYYPLGNPWATFLKKGMYVSYALQAEMPAGIFKEALYLDMENPYHYFRVDRQENKPDRIIIGGEDHRAEIKMKPQKNYQALRAYLAKIMDNHPYRIIRSWTGPILEPSDGLALIGRTKERELVATAFSGNGMTYSMISAELLTDIIRKKRNPFKDLYDPKRIPTMKQIAKKALDYGEELYGGAIKNALGK